MAAVLLRNGTDRRPARMGQGRFKDHIFSRKLLKDGIRATAFLTRGYMRPRSPMIEAVL